MNILKSAVLIGSILLLNLLLITHNTLAQEVVIDSKLQSLLKKSIEVNELNKSMTGYRIQIYSGAKRDKAVEMKTGFEQMDNLNKAYLLYQQPNFKVRVGDFKTRIEAASALEKIKGTFEIAFIVRDDVSLPQD
ncbi:MAG: SPOR domain-containing protein [Bacteroidia bacterium]|nr:SPOR domain-containing protein [Bacteroidia bacterium]HQU99577.1 SPOR domain-containing protein [Bacteroidia bacterium]